MEEAYELGPSPCKRDEGVSKKHTYTRLNEKIDEKDKDCRCSKMCLKVVVTVVVLLLAIAIIMGLLLLIRVSERMNKLEAVIAEVQDKCKSFAAEDISNSSNLVDKSSERMNKLEAVIAEVQDKCKSFAAEDIPNSSNLVDKNSERMDKLEAVIAKVQDKCKSFAAEEMSNSSNLVDKNTFWIGANDIQKEGDWKWAENNQSLSTSFYTNWATGEPNNRGNCYHLEDCAVVRTSSGKWNDICCHLASSYICKKSIFLL